MYGTVSFSRFKWDGAKQDIEIRNWKKKLFQVERFVRCEIDENISRAGNWSYEIKFVYRNCKQDIIILLRWNIEHKIMIIILNRLSLFILEHARSFRFVSTFKRFFHKSESHSSVLISEYLCNHLINVNAAIVISRPRQQAAIRGTFQLSSSSGLPRFPRASRCSMNKTMSSNLCHGRKEDRIPGWKCVSFDFAA